MFQYKWMYVEKKRPVALLEERLGRRGSPSQENEEGIVNKIEEKKKKRGKVGTCKPKEADVLESME